MTLIGIRVIHSEFGSGWPQWCRIGLRGRGSARVMTNCRPSISIQVTYLVLLLEGSPCANTLVRLAASNMTPMTPGTVLDVDADADKVSVTNVVEPKLPVLEGQYRQKWYAVNLNLVHE